MNIALLFLFVILFLVLGSGGVYFWKGSAVEKIPWTDWIGLGQSTALDGAFLGPIDAVLSPLQPRGACKAHSGQCGKGVMTSERKCISEGANGGKTCAQLLAEEEGKPRQIDCYVECPRPTNVVDWGHSNDTPGLPLTPRKGWYDFTGQGQPNDYCRWVGETKDKFWSCHTNKDPYVKADPNHVTFSAGPANKFGPVTKALVEAKCPLDAKYAVANDPDLQKSIVHGLMAPCAAGCVYDSRNPKTGWTFTGKEWVRVEDMAGHFCGIRHLSDMKNAVEKYDSLYDVKNSWTVA